LSLAACTHLVFQPLRSLVVDPQQLGLEYTEVDFTSADGTPLHGWFFPAQSSPIKGIFVQFHGNAENMSTHFRSLVWVTAYGYHLFTFDYRGYGQSGGQASMAGVHDDVLAAIVRARQLSASHGGRMVVLYGQSLGGTLLLYVVGTMSDRAGLGVVVVDSAFSSYRAIAREKLAGHWLTFLLQPLAYLLVSDRYAPDEVVAEISPVPLLILHGDADQIVPIHYGQRIYERARSPRWLWRLPGVGHIEAMSPRHHQYRQDLLDFLERLAAPAQPAPSQ
jgi:fermentation-respiration switch protein FrsA (DUF1100 family)